jgi:hypothetical protein
MWRSHYYGGGEERVARRGGKVRRRSAAHVALSVVILGVVAFGGGAGSDEAAAYQAYFCPSSGTKILINGSSGCTGGSVGALVRVYAETTNGNGVEHCAVGKQFSDGSGSDVIPAQCGSAQHQVTDCYPPRVGYPKVANRSSSKHYFHGDYDYVTCRH